MATGSPVSPHLENARTSTIKSSVHSSAPSRCTQCNSRQKENARNLIVCIDGTSNQFGQNNTNVVKLFAKINLESRNPEQYAYYSSGIGTRPKSLHILNRMERAVSDKFDMAVAWNMEEIVEDAYGWLARTYQEGDQIYLFGFSRGAYQVRVLAGMIHEVGLIRTHTEKQIGMAYDHYEQIRSGKPKTRQIAREFKNTFSWKDLRVHFVGVWDTVSSVGLIRGDVFLSTSSSAAHACHFRHALALDELRVKFMPEYFHEMNSQTDGGKSKYIIASDEQVTKTRSEKHASTSSGSGTSVSGGKKQRTTEIKEVWFAGSHSDVQYRGGRNRPGTSHQAGNVSLLWMRREAVEKGLVLDPTDIVWVPDDLDFGTSDSMSNTWKAIEYLPITHQVSFSGAGENARRWHRRQPRRIIPGQKVHASILCANAYKPQASLGVGFDIPLANMSLDEELDKDIWETGLFDASAAQELISYLSGDQGVAPIYLDRLLFMLRFKEGKQCVRSVTDWQNQFVALIRRHDCAPLVRLVTIVAYYEASCDPDAPKGVVQPLAELPADILNSAKQSLHAILAAHKHRDGPRVVALLRPLVNHKGLRENLLTEDVLDTLVRFLDVIISQKGGNFGQAMDGLSCLLGCEQTQGFIVKKLSDEYPGFGISRLGRILGAKDTHLLTAALRMVMAMTRIPQDAARTACSAVKPRIRELAKGSDRLVGLLAVEILLALYNPADPEQLDIRNSKVRANLASALVRWNPESGSSGQEILKNLFGLHATELTPRNRRLIGALTNAVRKGNARERTAATMTLLKLCETGAIRAHLLEINLLNILVDQLRFKDKALLAAYALANCLRYPNMKDKLTTSEQLPKNIVGMLRLDYFDDAVGQVEGFQIFGDFMQHADLRGKITKYNITEVLNAKLGRGKSKETRTSLICLDIFRSFDRDGPWTSGLVDKGLQCLRSLKWDTQKAGVTILSALAQTDHGVAAITPKLDDIIKILLPEGYLLIQPDEAETNPADATPVPTFPTVPVTATGFPDGGQPADDTEKPSSWMFGPACALRVLAQNKELRDLTRKSMQYATLKHLYLSGTLVDDVDTSPWRVWTPNRNDVTDMLDKMIKSVDEELSEEGLMSVGDGVLPHIRHWNRLITLLRDKSVAVITVLPALLGLSVLAVLAMVVVVPIYASVHIYELLKLIGSRWLDSRILDGLHGGGASNQGEMAGGVVDAHGNEDMPGPSGQGEQGSQGVEVAVTVETSEE